ncbi:BLUF domain-containing protein [Mucilaginibacter sp. 14171R-50]|uniref:BLUF domain-containing protein n=1 Tax=Mucilaginibacter sp. 14171R-50 TaxID=2703789 RepID=UPI00138BE88D|nr:BLUF domain-containing protein [Mucilaginibacter sp. 14171R-50]QHS57201.1 BLUF domain-containing protein [Mucilaginibacter sp. 14171R-50]
MKNIVYLSTAVKLLHENQLFDILHNSRQHNAAVGISGVLLYADGNFIQVIEGKDSVIDALYARIQADQRHTNIIKLIDEPIAEKNFSEWLMGFAVTDITKAEKLLGYLKSVADLDLNKRNSSVVAAIKNFIENNRLNVE